MPSVYRRTETSILFWLTIQEEPKFERWKREIETTLARSKFGNRQVFNTVEGKSTDLTDAFEDLGAQLRVSLSHHEPSLAECCARYFTQH